MLSRQEASAAVGDQGWRFVLGTLRTAIRVDSLTTAVTVSARAVEACAEHADGHLRLDLRPDCVLLTLHSEAAAAVTDQDTELATRITTAVHTLGLTTSPKTGPVPTPTETAPPTSPAGPTPPVAEAAPASPAQGFPPIPAGAAPPPSMAGPTLPVGDGAPASPAGGLVPVGGVRRPVQELEIAIDALDIAGIRPFWKAVLGYVDEADRTGPEDPLIDPLRQGPAVWFQRMAEPRPQRNRIHLDISVPHDEAPARIAAALAAGGRMVSDRRAPAFWVLADREDNEVCITTWQGRDP